MGTLQSFFRATADLVTGQFPSGGMGRTLSFYDNVPDVPIARLPGFSQVPEPSSRFCCAIGWRPSRNLLPDMTATQPMELESLGHNTHRYGGPSLTIGGLLNPEQLISRDPVGHLYTARGGVVDIGHVRDHADLARYLAVKAYASLENGQLLNLKHEAGRRRVAFLPQGTPPSPRLCALLGARISYELSIWHEMVTWISPVILERQQYSAFSPEDNFSNLLGAYLGFRAILEPDTDFDTAMSRHLLSALVALAPVSKFDTEVAINYVENRWFEYQSENLVLLRRHFDALPTVTPWLVQSITIPKKEGLLDRLRQVTFNDA